MAKFEAHITCPKEYASKLVGQANQSQKEDSEMTWFFSVIDGDLIMGAKPYCYLTAYHTNPRRLLDCMEAMVAVLDEIGVPVLRQKIEQIVYDTKTGVNELVTKAACSRCGGTNPETRAIECQVCGSLS